MKHKVGYARVSTEQQDVSAQIEALERQGIQRDLIFVDHGMTGRTLDREGLKLALTAVREGDTFIVTKLDRLARSISDFLTIAKQLEAKGVALQIGEATYDPNDPMGKLLFNVLAMVAEFEGDLIRQRTREGMKIAKAKGRLRGKQPTLSAKDSRRLREMAATQQFTISEIARVFGISRATVYRYIAHDPNARPVLPSKNILGGAAPVAQRGQTAPIKEEGRGDL